MEKTRSHKGNVIQSGKGFPHQLPFSQSTTYVGTAISRPFPRKNRGLGRGSPQSVPTALPAPFAKGPKAIVR